MTGRLKFNSFIHIRRRKKALNSKSEIDQGFITPLLAIVAFLVPMKRGRHRLFTTALLRSNAADCLARCGLTPSGSYGSTPLHSA